MNDLEKAKKNYRKLQKKFSDAVDSCSPESSSMWDKVKLVEKKFLKIHSKYVENDKKFQKRFLEISKEFGYILNEQKKMHEKFTKLLNPFPRKIDRLLAKLEKLEKKQRSKND